MSISDIFASFRSAAPAQNVPATTPTAVGPTAIPTAAPSNPQAITPAPSEPAPPVSPLDAFKDLWQPAKEGAPAAPTLDGNIFNTDPTKLFDASRKIDFSKGVQPELLQKALSGDAAALAQAMNQIAQQTYAQSAHLMTQMVERGIAENNTRIQGILPDTFRSLQVKESLATNPLYSNPATKPVMEALQAQLTRQYPQASAEQITQHAKAWIDGVVQAASPATPNPATTLAPGETDWSKYLTS